MLKGKRMNTMTKSASLTLGVKDLRDLLTGAVIFTAGEREGLPALNSVALKSEGGILTAAATDRYRLIEGFTPVYVAKEDQSHEFDQILISEKSVKSILLSIKDQKTGNVTLELIDNNLSVLSENFVNISSLVDATFPPYRQLFEGEAVAVEEIVFNPSYFADFGKIAGKKGGVNVQFRGPNKAILIDFNGDLALSGANWRGLLMPQRKA